MKFKKIIIKILTRIKQFKAHPLTKNSVITALFRYVLFNTIQTINPKQRKYKFLNGLHFHAQKGDAGIVANIYFKLFDYDESMFVIHHLKENELFVDVGANVGHFTLIAAGICKAKVIAFEPIPATFSNLNKNVTSNNLGALVKTFNIGIGEKKGFLNFSTNLDVMNAVALEHEPNVIRIAVEKLDYVLEDNFPVFLKIDVEGYEMFVLKGALDVLSNPSLKVIIIELNFSLSKFQHSIQDVINLLTKYDFIPIEYDVQLRKIRIIEGYSADRFNTIFMKRNLAILFND